MCIYMQHTKLLASTLQQGELYTYLTHIIEPICLRHPKYGSHNQHAT